MKHLMWFVVGILLLAQGGCSKSEEIKTEEIAIKLSKEVQKGQYQLVSTPELKTWLNQKKPMLVVDTMPYEASYKKHHIPGAIQFEFPIAEINQLDAKTKDRFEELLGADKDRLIVFYCGFTKCGRSHNSAMWAVKLGYTNVYRCPGGIQAWREAGYTTAEGENETIECCS